ncbi:hypothetical protein GCM10027562_06000 [Arthrobacter pigmenti]
MDYVEQVEKDATIERLSSLAREDQLRKHHDEENSQQDWPAWRQEARAEARPQEASELEAALRCMHGLGLRTLQLLEREASGRESANVAQFIRLSLPSRYFQQTVLPAAARAILLDTLTYKDIQLAHGDTMFKPSINRVKDVLGLTAQESLAEEGCARYGPDGVFAVLDIAASFADLQLTKTAAHITSSMGYAGIDAYADAKDACHSMTVKFARFVLTTAPSTDDLLAMLDNGRLTTFGISPVDFDKEQLRTELSKLPRTSTVAPDLPTELPLARSDWMNDDGTSRFKVTSIERPRTAGDAHEQHLTRQTSARRRQADRLLSVALPVAAALIAVWAAQSSLERLYAERPFTAWGALLVLVFFEAMLGWLFYKAVFAVIDFPAESFFHLARNLNYGTVLQGRRDPEFLNALRSVRPEAFTRSKNAGLGRLFAVFVDEGGILLLGPGRQPSIVAAFHWLHVRDVAAAKPSGKHSASAGSADPKVEFLLKTGGSDVPLRFPLERAKVAWTQRSFLEAKPMDATLSYLRGRLHLTTAMLGGSANSAKHEADALEYETRRRAPLQLASSNTIRSRRTDLARAFVFIALLYVAALFAVSLL